MRGRIDAICVSKRKGERKRPVQSALLIQDSGIEGDAHAGPWHRQVSLLAVEDVDEVRRSGMPDLKAGDFAENILVSGMGFERPRLGKQAQAWS